MYKIMHDKSSNSKADAVIAIKNRVLNHSDEQYTGFKLKPLNIPAPYVNDSKDFIKKQDKKAGFGRLSTDSYAVAFLMGILSIALIVTSLLVTPALFVPFIVAGTLLLSSSFTVFALSTMDNTHRATPLAKVISENGEKLAIYQNHQEQVDRATLHLIDLDEEKEKLKTQLSNSSFGSKVTKGFYNIITSTTNDKNVDRVIKAQASNTTNLSSTNTA